MANRITEEGRFSWCYLIQEDDNGKTRTNLLLKEADAEDIFVAIEDCLLDEFGEDADVEELMQEIGMPYKYCEDLQKEHMKKHDGERFEAYDDFDVSVTFWTRDPIDICDDTGEPIDNPTKKHVYSGCFGRVSYDPYYFKHKSGTENVILELCNVLTTGEGTAFEGNKASGREDFKDVAKPKRSRGRNGAGRTRDDESGDEEPRGRRSSRRNRDEDQDDEPRNERRGRRGRNEDNGDEEERPSRRRSSRRR